MVGFGVLAGSATRCLVESQGLRDALGVGKGFSEFPSPMLMSPGLSGCVRGPISVRAMARIAVI